jgi:hypothetical protein
MVFSFSSHDSPISPQASTLHMGASDALSHVDTPLFHSR